mmetsp:Transcript_16188/g.27286  ORF Transcript_16188/g.27286 Transcript_16188/m.27286 type:complete len:431 (-) Transcript_16188:41-1333(-)
MVGEMMLGRLQPSSSSSRAFGDGGGKALRMPTVAHLPSSLSSAGIQITLLPRKYPIRTYTKQYSIANAALRRAMCMTRTRGSPGVAVAAGNAPGGECGTPPELRWNFCARSVWSTGSKPSRLKATAKGRAHPRIRVSAIDNIEKIEHNHATPHLAPEKRVVVVWDLDNVRLQGPSQRAEAMLSTIQEVYCALDPLISRDDMEIQAFANQETIGHPWFCAHGVHLLKQFGVKLHEVPTTDQAADTLLREYVQRTLGLSTNPDAHSDTQAAQGTLGGVQGTFGGVQGTSGGVQGTIHNKNTTLVLISRDHGFAPMLTQARQAGVLTVLLLPVAYKSQTIDVSGSGGAKLAHAVDIVAAFHVFIKTFQDSVTEVAPLREGSERHYDCILVGLVCWPLSAHVAADVRAERSSIEASLRLLYATPPSNARWLPRR